MIPPNSLDDELIALRRSYVQGKVPREELWARMQAANNVLLKYASLLAEGEADSIMLGPTLPLLRLRNGLVFELNPADLRTAPNMVLIHGTYETLERRVMEELARGARTILDVGANVGWYSVHLAKAALRQEAKLHAFEPIPTTFATLNRNLALNSLQDRVACHAVGLGEQRRSARFFVPEGGTDAASLAPPPVARPVFEVECDLWTLDEWSVKHDVTGIDLIKVDIEGAELFFFRGAIATLARNRPAILCEMLRKWAARFNYHPNDIIATLEPLGYRCWEFGSESLRPLTSVTDATLSTNFLFLHADQHSTLSDQLSALKRISV